MSELDSRTNSYLNAQSQMFEDMNVNHVQVMPMNKGISSIPQYESHKSIEITQIRVTD